VEVPIPEGMDIVDLDSSEEEQELRILNLRRALSSAELRIHRLEEELESIIARREALEQHRTANLNREKVIRDNTDTLKKALVDLTRATEAILQSVTAGPAE
jgi:chromosome segregation ATPase